MLRHPGIVKIHDISADDQAPFIVSELIDGQTLEDVLGRQRVSVRDAAELVARIADALEYGHQHGVLHRDIKPKNIMINADGQPVILDFGIARADRDETLIAGGEALGTPAYMSPERVITDSTTVDPTADVYSLAVVLYVILAGELPFRGSTARIIHQIVHDEPLPPRHYCDDIPADLQTICLKGMNKSPARRYLTASAFADDLRRFLDGRPIAARPVTRFEKCWRWCLRNPLAATLSAVTLISLVALAVGGVAAAIITSKLARAEQASRSKGQIQLSRGLAESGVLKLQQGDLRGLADLVRSVDPARIDSRELASRLTLADHWGRSHLGRLAQVVGMEHPIRSMTLSPSGRYMCTVDVDGNAQVWDCETGRPQTAVKPWRGDATHPQSNAQFSEDEKRLISIEGQCIQAWDWQKDQMKNASLDGIAVEMRPSSLAVYHDGTHVLFCARLDDSRSIHAFDWDTDSGDIRDRFEVGPLSLGCGTFDQAGSHLAFGDGQGNVSVYDVSTGSLKFSQQGHDHGVNLLVFDSNSNWLASSSEDRTVRIWNLREPSSENPLLLHDEDIKDMAFSPDGSLLATASYDGAIRIWRTSNATQVCPEMEHHAPVLAVAFNQDGTIVASGGFDSQVRLWSLPQGRPFDIPIPTSGIVGQLMFRGDSNELIVAGSSSDVHLWKTSGIKPSGQIIPQSARVWSVDFSADGRSLIIASQEGPANIWSVADAASASAPPLGGGRLELLCARLHPDLHRLLSLNVGWFFVQDLRQPDQLPFRSDNKGFRFAEFSGNGNVAVVGSEYNGAFLVDFTNRDYRMQMLEGPMDVNAVAIDRAGSRVAAACRNGSIWLWNTLDGKSLERRLAHNDNLEAIAFSPDGKLIATAARDLTVRLWNSVDCSPVGPTIAQQAPVESLAFSPTEPRLARTDTFNCGTSQRRCAVARRSGTTCTRLPSISVRMDAC